MKKFTCDVAGFSDNGDCGKKATHIIKAGGEDGDIFFCQEHAKFYKDDFPTMKKIKE